MVLTNFGRFAVDLQLDPRISRIVYAGIERKLWDTATTLASLLTIDGNVWWRGGSQQRQNESDLKKASLLQNMKCIKAGDAVIMVKIFEKWQTIDQSWVAEAENGEKNLQEEPEDDF